MGDVRALGVPRDIYIMLSNGGITSCQVAGEYPIRLIESGPAAGALAASFYSLRKNLDRVISFDMGGTTAKICLIDRGQPMLTTDFEAARVYRFKKGSGLPLKVPVIEMIEIGAGGGSIARVDTLGLLLHAIVHSAGIQDRDGGIILLATLFGQFPFLEKLFADSAYQGPIFGNALAKILPCLKTEIVKRSDQAKGFVPLPKRWIVERTIAWLNRCRRLAKDWENLNRNALAFLKLASIRLMLRKLCNP